MLKGSKQIKIFDWNLERGLLDKAFNPALQTRMLTEESREFYDAYKANDMVGMIDAYCDFIFVLRGAQASLIATDFGDDYGAYRTALDIVNGATNQGFMMLEILNKAVPVGPVELELCLSYVIEANEAKPKDTVSGKIIKGDNWRDPKDKIRALVFPEGNEEEDDEAFFK